MPPPRRRSRRCQWRLGPTPGAAPPTRADARAACGADSTALAAKIRKKRCFRRRRRCWRSPSMCRRHHRWTWKGQNRVPVRREYAAPGGARDDSPGLPRHPSRHLERPRRARRHRRGLRPTARPGKRPSCLRAARARSRPPRRGRLLAAADGRPPRAVVPPRRHSRALLRTRGRRRRRHRRRYLCRRWRQEPACPCRLRPRRRRPSP
mmetsp:Transcript_30386/g.93802  ORF Transcript_30386/g.93802 Transcript_30386/m.93802 type:complete len:207 (-) Transcript_30386:115-735(-)